MVTGSIAVTRTVAANVAANTPVPKKEKEALAAATQVAFKKCVPFKDCRTGINDTFVDYADFIHLAMHIYNLVEYSEHYSDTSGSLWGFKRDEVINNENMTNDDNAPSFKYKAGLITDTKADRTGLTVPQKYFSNFWRSLEIPLINCKVKLLLKWIANCVLTTPATGADANATSADSATFKITDAKNYIPAVILST